MGIEQIVNQKLNKFPGIKRKVKRIYQWGMYAVSEKMKSEGDIEKISPDDFNHEYFFGYYDKSPWDITDRYILCMRATDTWSDVSPKEKADILLIDTQKSKYDLERIHKIANTHAWNVQQGCMLQWLGPDYSKKVIFNDYRSGKYCSVIITLDINDGSVTIINERVISEPVYSVSADGTFALTLDFSRLHRLRPGYGYHNIVEKTANEKLPDNDCIWYIDLVSGAVSAVLKYTDFARFDERPEMRGAEHKINHIMLSPNGKRFMVLHRWIKNGRKYTRLLTCNIDGTDMYKLSDDDMVSHCCWRTDTQILAFENKKKNGNGYYLMKDKTQEFVRFWPGIDYDGHPSYSPDGKKVLFDRYPDRARIAAVMISDAKNRKTENVKTVARVFAPFKYDNDTRCDLHPRWNHSGDEICFDSVFEGHRGVYTVKLSGKTQISNEKKVQVLYVLDSLKQRFGVTAVVMNYFRNIDKRKIKIDFLILEDSEEALTEEIEKSGSNVYFMPALSIKQANKFFDFINIFFKEHNDYKAVHSHFNQLDAMIFPIAKKNGIKHCISHSHNTKYSDYRIKAVRNWMMCLPIKQEATVWAACGIKAGEFLYGKKFLNSSKHLIINNAINTQLFSYNPLVRKEVRRSFGLGDDILLGNVGSMKPQKNQFFLLEVFADLVRSNINRNYKLMIVGDGDLRIELIEKAKKLGIFENIIFTGQRNDVNRLLQAMDIFLLPSLYEGLPVVGVEAQASGLPCIFSSTITREIAICNNVFLDIDKGTECWIHAIKDRVQFDRYDTSEEILKKNFDIVKEADRLCSFYVQLQ